MKVRVRVECCRTDCPAFWEGWVDLCIKVTEESSVTFGSSGDYTASIEIEPPDGWNVEGYDIHGDRRFLCPEVHGS